MKEDFFNFIQPSHLYTIALFFGIVTVILVGLIYLYLYRKKIRFRAHNKIRAIVEDWMSDMLVGEQPETDITVLLKPYFNKQQNRQLVIDYLVNTKKNLKGSSTDAVVVLYDQLGLRKDSLKKFKSRTWHKKAKGIFELYMMGKTETLELFMMGQADIQQEILQYTDSDNEYIRMEAQTAMIGFAGFKGLSFLNTLTMPLVEWQQLKLIEQLQSFTTVELNDLPFWLGSDNPHVVLFALKLADIYREIKVHDEVVNTLQNSSEKIRKQAIKTLSCINQPQTNDILIKQYATETRGNKAAILRELANIGTSADMPFLLSVFQTGDQQMQLEAARAIANCDNRTWLQLNSTADNAALPILQQVKYELAL